MNIDLKQLEGLLKVLEERDISEFEFEDEKARIHLKRGQPIVALAQAAHGSAAGAELSIPSVSSSVTDTAAKEGVFVTSPFVGTFYRSPSPEAPPFVEVGASIKPGQPLCIVEAMKLMNEIEAEFSGVVLECMVDTGSPVEFGQKLFRVKKV